MNNKIEIPIFYTIVKGKKIIDTDLMKDEFNKQVGNLK